MSTLNLLGRASAVTAMALAMTAAPMAQDAFPSKDITFIVQAAAGGGSDRSSRALVAEMEKDLGVSIIVENRPGASGTIAYAHVAEQAPDGYTIGFSPVEHAILEHIGFEFDRSEFTYLGQIMNSPVVLAVAADSPYNTMEEFLEAAKTKTMSVGNAGPSTATAVATVQLSELTGAQLSPVPFDGSAPAVAAVMGGHVDAVAAGAGETATGFADGTLKVLTIFNDVAHPALEGVPTSLELGIDLTMGLWGGVYGPAGMPADVVEVLQNAVEKAALSDEFREAVAPAGILPVFKNGAEFTAFVESESQRYGAALQ